MHLSGARFSKWWGILQMIQCQNKNPFHIPHVKNSLDHLPSASHYFSLFRAGECIILQFPVCNENLKLCLHKYNSFHLMRGNKHISSTETSGSHAGRKSDLITNSLTAILWWWNIKTLQCLLGQTRWRGSGLVTQRRTSAAAVGPHVSEPTLS